MGEISGAINEYNNGKIVKSILLIAHSSAEAGGGEDDFLRLLKHLYGRYTLYAAFPQGPRVNVYKKYVRDSIILNYNIFHFTSFKLMEYMKYLKRGYDDGDSLLSFLSDKKIDVCFINSSVSFVLIPSIVKKKIPIVLSIKEVISPSLVRKIVYKFISKYVCAVIVISDLLRKLYKDITRLKKCYLVHSAIEFENICIDEILRNKLAESRNFTILNIGVIAKHKSQETLIEAIEGRYTGIEVKFIGQIGEESYLQYLKSRIGFSKNNYIFKGIMSKEDVLSEISNCDCVVITSLSEGQSIVAIEAMYLEKPLIASKVGIISEVLINGQNGLIFEPGDSDTLSKQIGKLFNDRNFAKNLSKGNRKIIEEKFILNENLNKIEKILLNCVNDGSDSNPKL